MTYVFANILNIVREQAHLALVTKWTCKPAQFLATGIILHQLFGLLVPVLPSSVSSIKTMSGKATVLHKASVILIDEMSTISAVAVWIIYFET